MSIPQWKFNQLTAYICISLQQVLSVVHSHKKNILLYISLVVVDCGDPGQPENGMKWLRSTTLGSYVKYKCFEGYKLKGYGYRKCLSDGQWSRSLPTCEGEPQSTFQNVSFFRSQL